MLKRIGPYYLAALSSQTYNMSVDPLVSLPVLWAALSRILFLWCEPMGSSVSLSPLWEVVPGGGLLGP